MKKILPHQNKWLARLGQIARPPTSLNYLGILPDQAMPTVAIVGSRKPTRYGEEMAFRLASQLATAGVVVVSGLAVGIDGTAHKGALEASGRTVAVLGNGLPAIYPARHQGLARRIVEAGGAIISEYPSGMPALPHHFLERNRLVAGLSDAVLVIEAAERSGTLSTAAHALEQGRTVFALPGSVLSPLSAGCNNLIKQGAFPATSVDDILRALPSSGAIAGSIASSVRSYPTTEPEKAIFELLIGGLTDGDQIMGRLNLSASDFAVAMTMLQIGDFVVSLGANQWSVN